MPSPRIHPLGRVRPVLGSTLPRSNAVLSPPLPQRPDHRETWVPARLVPALRMMFWCAAGIVALLVAAVVYGGGR